jgi:hypothetical protein
VYNYYVDLNVAIPGTKMPHPIEWRQICKGKMINLHLVPEVGNIKSSWIKADPDIMNVYYYSVEDSLLNVFSDAIDQVLVSPETRNEIFESQKEKIRALFNSANSYVNLLYDNFEKRLHRWLLVNNKKKPFPTEDSIFGDYEPKRTPDTILDYAPQIADSINKLTEPEMKNLQNLILLFEKYQSAADSNPGHWEDGNIILGANQKEYRPSEKELILSVIGDRIKIILESEKPLEATDFYSINYKEFVITHVDVMGSGRFFYVDDINTIQLKVPRTE